MGKTLLLEQRKYGSNIKNHFYVVPFYFHIDFKKHSNQPTDALH